jgi:DNA-binding MarR family transcriptional regulator
MSSEIGGTQREILIYLATHPGITIANYITARRPGSPAEASRFYKAIDALARRRLLQKQPGRDRREKLLKLTGEGTRLVKGWQLTAADQLNLINSTLSEIAAILRRGTEP